MRSTAACVLVLQAAAAGAADTSLDETIVVTARRVEERADSVPLAVQVLPAEEFQRSSVNGLYAVSARAPGLSFESTWGGGVALPTLRGQFSPSLGDTVGVFVDGVHQASRSALDIELLDFERIEVVYGPQSTLYGHGTFAGAIGYVSSPPTRTLTGGATAELGSDRYRHIEGWISGPLSGRWLGRLAASSRRFDGTITNLAAPDEQLGGADRRAVALTLALAPDDASPYDGSISARYEDSRYVHPATASVEAPEYNCGARDRASGLWSYFCGPLPAEPDIRLTPGLPDSETRAGQVLLRLGFDLGSMRLESETSWYDASSDLVRDFDASDRGVQYGVCTLGVNCTGPAGVPRPVNRLVYTNQVAHDLQDTRQVSQELRLHGSVGRATWMVGGVAFDMRDLVRPTFGTASGDLQPNEQLTALLPATPQLAGPLSLANRSLVADPLTMQVERQNVENRQRSYGLFGTIDYSVTEAFKLRGELRGTRERRSLDSRVVNFQPSFGKAIAPQWFEDVTTRLSLEYRASPALLAYVSAAKGSRPGGINAQPGLPAGEQVYQPEFNWTWEVGLRHRGDGLLRSMDATAYYVDWRDTQINGFSSQLGLTNPIVLNTGGITTRGIELAAEIAPTDWLRAQLAWSLTDPEFRAGSDDYGSSGFCGLSSQNSTSSFCTVGPPRSANPNLPAVVPWIDGNVQGRVPRVTWHAALTADMPFSALDGQGWARVDVNHQDDVYERQINGAYFGRRTLVDARMGISREPWSIELWGTNLTDKSYARSSFGKFPVFYPTQPRPLDQIYADGRRIGITVRWSLR